MRNSNKNKILSGLCAGLITVIMLMMPGASTAQTLEIGVSGGVSYYLGDINPALPYVYSQPAYGALARYNINNRWSARFSYSRGKLKGADAKSNVVQNRDLNFETKINDFSLVGEFNFWDYFTGSSRNYFTPYVFGGVGFFTFKPFNFNGVNLQAHGTEGQQVGFDGRSPYKLWGISFSFGFGFKYSLSRRLALGFEWGMRKTFTDYIDDISTTYYTSGDPVSDPTGTHEAYMQRGNESNMDWFNFTLLSLTYKFNLYGSKKCRDNKW